MTVIHFLDLEDMIPELDPVYKVRINKQVLPVYTYVETPDMSIVHVCLSVRQLRKGGIVSWMIATGEYETYRNNPHTDNDEEAAKLAWTELERIEGLIEKRLLEQDDAFKIRPGLIDLGTSPMAGVWSELGQIKEEVIEDVDDSDSEQRDNSDPDDDEIPF